MPRWTRFDWDAGNLAKCQQHGVTIDEIEDVFRSDPFLGPDDKHSVAEQRYVAIGFNGQGRPIFVVFTLRLDGDIERVRPVSVRYMHRKEIRRYEHLWRTENPPTSDR